MDTGAIVAIAIVVILLGLSAVAPLLTSWGRPKREPWPESERVRFWLIAILVPVTVLTVVALAISLLFF